MRPFRLPTHALAALLALAAALPAQTPTPNPAERTETWEDGKPKARYTVDEAGRRHGVAEEFAANGTRTLQATYSHGLRDGVVREWNDDGSRLRVVTYKKDVLHGHAETFHGNGTTAEAGDYKDGLRTGRWLTQDAAGDQKRTAEYVAGVLSGAVRIERKGKPVSKQTWKDGELLLLDDLQPFPVPRHQLWRELRAILQLPATPDPQDPRAGERQAALRRLQAYRHLCRLPWQEMSLVPEWNLRCDAAAEICRRLGHLDHTPPRPDGMDEERFRLGYDGTTHSNLAAGQSMVDSVDGFMDDSDPSNIDRVGHRRWCLNPVMLKTGFGNDGGFSAMWSMDGSGKAPRNLDAVFYPPRGHVPVDLFTARRAFSIGLLRGGAPKAADLKPVVRALDDDFLPTGEPLALDWCGIAGGGYGHLPALVFRPVGIQVEPGRRYLVEVSCDGGKTQAFRYVVAFGEPLGPAEAVVR